MDYRILLDGHLDTFDDWYDLRDRVVAQGGLAASGQTVLIHQVYADNRWIPARSLHKNALAVRRDQWVEFVVWVLTSQRAPDKGRLHFVEWDQGTDRAAQVFDLVFDGPDRRTVTYHGKTLPHYRDEIQTIRRRLLQRAGIVQETDV